MNQFIANTSGTTPLASAMPVAKESSFLSNLVASSAVQTPASLPQANPKKPFRQRPRR
jgi:hypothetical protein